MERPSVSDEDAVKGAMDVLRDIFTVGQNVPVPDPLDAACVRWGGDRHAFGSYSNISVGATGEDYDHLASTVGDRLFFAGEATNRMHPATMHGAFLSGVREAALISDALVKLDKRGTLRPPRLKSEEEEVGAGPKAEDLGNVASAAFPAASSAVDPAVRRHATGGGWPMGSGPPRGVMCGGGPGGTSGAWSLELRRATRDSVLGLERGLARLGGRDLRCLVSLSLRNGGKGLGDDGVSHLARALRDAVPRLKSLCLAGNDVGVDGAKALSEALAGRTRADASEDVVGGVAVGGVALEELDLSGNSIGGEGTCALADALNTTGCAKLRALNLARCAIGARGAVAIAEIIRGQARSIRWSPYDRVGVANADP